jgi:hypothetical protein
MKELDIIKGFGFKYSHTEEITNLLGHNEYVGTFVDAYINDTHRIFHWKKDNKFSIKNLETTSSTFQIDFEYVIKKYIEYLIKNKK